MGLCRRLRNGGHTDAASGFAGATALTIVILAAGAASAWSAAAAAEGGGEGIVLRSQEEVELLFVGWKVIHGKSYSGDAGEERRRFEIFKNNLRLIDEHNRPENNHTFTLGLNIFADLTHEEYQSMYLARSEFEEEEPAPKSDLSSTETSDLTLLAGIPDSIDWRTRGAVGPVKNQGQCGSCWVFAAVATVESVNAIATKKTVIPLSEQEILDCGPNSTPCDGGDKAGALKYIVSHGGIDTQANYPYKVKREVCKANRKKVGKIDGYASATPYREDLLKGHVARQPISVSIDASQKVFQFYKTGIITGDCGFTRNHAVTIVGYGSEGGIDYWLIKNSWGTRWGDGGYVKIQRNVEDPRGMCLVAIAPVYPKKAAVSSVLRQSI